MRVAGTERIHTQGALTQTDNALDLAIEGEGFFAVSHARWPAGLYPRRLSNCRQRARWSRRRACGSPQPITIPEGAQRSPSAPDGTVTATLQGEAAPVEAGPDQVTRFLNPAGLEPKGDNLYAETAASGAPQTGAAGVDGAGTLRQGALEGSNVIDGAGTRRHDRDPARL